MISAIVSFLGGSVFRMLWGELSAWITRRQDHAHDLDLMREQEKIAAAQHARNQAAIKAQAEMQVQVVRVQGEAEVGTVEAGAWADAVRSVGRPSGIWLVDLLNGLVRPALAITCIALWVAHVGRAGWVLDEQGWAILGATLGLYIADRTLAKRGK